MFSVQRTIATGRDMTRTNQRASNINKKPVTASCNNSINRSRGLIETRAELGDSGDPETVEENEGVCVFAKDDKCESSRRLIRRGERVSFYKLVRVPKTSDLYVGERCCEDCYWKLYYEDKEKKLRMKQRPLIVIPKTHKCDTCDARFEKKKELERHIRSMHESEKAKPCICKICDSAFAYKSHLKKHMRTHTGEKPHKCEFCDAAFAQRGHLKTHMLTHTKEKPHKCEFCDAAFAQPSALKTHKLTHTGEKPYKCEFCDAAFADSSTLKTHKRTHTGEKPHKCDICEKEFAHSGSLKRHMLTHTREKATLAFY